MTGVPKAVRPEEPLSLAKRHLEGLPARRAFDAAFGLTHGGMRHCLGDSAIRHLLRTSGEVVSQGSAA